MHSKFSAHRNNFNNSEMLQKLYDFSSSIRDPVIKLSLKDNTIFIHRMCS